LISFVDCRKSNINVFTRKKVRTEVIPKKPKKIDPTAGMDQVFANAGIGIVRREDPAYFGGYAPMNQPLRTEPPSASVSVSGIDTPRSMSGRSVIRPRPFHGPVPPEQHVQGDLNLHVLRRALAEEEEKLNLRDGATEAQSDHGLPPLIKEGNFTGRGSVLGTGGQELDLSMREGMEMVDSVSVSSGAPMLQSTKTQIAGTQRVIDLEGSIEPKKYEIGLKKYPVRNKRANFGFGFPNGMNQQHDGTSGNN
jgi:hypothetical protein